MIVYLRTIQTRVDRLVVGTGRLSIKTITQNVVAEAKARIAEVCKGIDRRGKPSWH